MSGIPLPVADPRLEAVDFYNVSTRKVTQSGVEEAAEPPVARCSTAASGLPGTRTSATGGTNLRGKMHELPVGLPDGNRDDR